MRFIIHGAGAIGTLVGGKLAAAGAEVVLVARELYAEAINRNGLRLLTQAGEAQVRNLTAVTHPAQLTPRAEDVILLTVKTAQTEESAHVLRDALGEETPIVCLQNAVRNEEWAARRFKNVYGAMAGISATLVEPGVVAWTMGDTISLGNYPLGFDEFGAELAAALTQAGFRTTTHEHIMGVKWSKLLLNLNNATLGIIDSYVQLAQVTPALAYFMSEVLEEGLHVLTAAHIVLDATPYNVPAVANQLRNCVEDTEKIRAAQSLPVELRTYPSTWVDLKQRRGATEAGYFNGEIILLGEKYDVPTPYNSTVLNIVETMAVEQLEPGKHSLDELVGLVEQRRLMIYHS
ncbi:MAG: ketopantoate reductase family protein [Acidobacteria bacterium]|nr:ketopantoate reductase family protein [Acidobacteriota bacterium]MBI3425078.1 ketopantoate reductase family protein [Acidobacteriota bacterium]